MKQNRSLILFGFLAVLLLAGCARIQTRMMQTELEQVAKRWCLTVRASQVIPVYPLTEDLQPGDVFIVQTPVANQVSEYSRRGYLPMDIHLHRLEALNYSAFYGDGYLKGDFGQGVPHPRPVPQSSTNGGRQRFALAPLPASAFPDYTFEASKGLGARLAFPVSGVPVGMSFMGANKVSGSVRLSDAFTYGINDAEVLNGVYAWAEKPEVRLMLARMRSHTRQPLFLRVVSRVYLVGGVTISLQAQGAGSGGVDAGAAKPLNPMAMTKEDAEELKTVAAAYKEAANAMASAINDTLPGGSLRFASANRGSVVMEEDFGRLLAIGYVGFDVEVDSLGRLGAPVATSDILEKRAGAARRLFAGLSTRGRTVAEGQVRELHRLVFQDSRNGEAMRPILAQLDAFGDALVIPKDLPVFVREADGLKIEGDIATKLEGVTGFKRYDRFRSELNKSLRALRGEAAETFASEQARLERADVALGEAFETSPQVALALRIFYEEVLMHAE